jgi:hypothetical protein
MEPETTCTSNDTTEKVKLYMAMELSQKEWKLGFSVGPGQAPRLRSVAGRDLGGLMAEIQLARERFGLGKEVESCYEAGRGTDSPEGHRDDVVASFLGKAGGEESGGGLGEH